LLIAELPVKNGEVEISFDQPKREWSGRITRPTLNLFLYDVRENVTLRQHQWEQLGNGADPRNLAHMKRTPMRIDCSYVLTTWAADPQDEHRLLTRALMALFRFPLLPENRLVGGLRNPAFPLQARLGSHDKLTSPTDLWNVLDNEIRPSVSYMITLALDPWQEIIGPLVRTLTLRSGQAFTQPRYRVLVEDQNRIDMVFIGGTVRRLKDKAPVPQAEVALKGTGIVTTTDAEGRFRLGSMPPGSYTLVVWVDQDKPFQKNVSIPAKDGDYDVEV
jgi:hypothetical protein